MNQIKKESMCKEKTTELSVDDANGMAWWNNMTDDQRAEALKKANEAGHKKPSAHDAWRVYKSNNETK